jgi:hypothetical protein
VLSLIFFVFLPSNADYYNRLRKSVKGCE